ncbi:MAG: hypothetical protein KDI13_06145 [Alphaproteobacteria bacterium]|nr:hypothetical protein [Alphaproteobacteria bacterium]
MKAGKLKQDNTQTTQSIANVVDGKLILSLPEAATPVIWQMDLEQAQSCALEVKEDKKSKQFILALKNTDGGITEIAPFETKEAAVSALMATSAALQGAHGKIRPATYSNVQAIPSAQAGIVGDAEKKKKTEKLGPVLAMLLIFVLLATWTLSVMLKGRPAPGQLQTTASSTLGGSSQPGQAMSADEFLNSRQ